MPRSNRLLLASLCLLPALADHLGANYLPPHDISSNKSTIPPAWKNITSTLHEHLKPENVNSTLGGVTGLENTTFSLGMFSLHDSAASDFQFHYTSPEVANSPNGTNKVDGNSIYRVASITKVFTVLVGMLELNSTQWDLPFTDIFPGIEELASQIAGGDDAIDTIQWDKITPSNVAAQLSGIPTNPFGSDLAVQFILQSGNPTDQGFPTLNESDPLSYPSCLTFENTTCYLPQIAGRAPNFLPWDRPLYSNNNFILLTAALQNLTGKDLSSMCKDDILDPLEMSNSYSGEIPESEWSKGVIVDAQEFGLPISLTVGSGGLASTVNDLAKFGIGVLNSTLLPTEETRNWLKPVTHTGRFQYSMGRPWEILRYTHTSGAVTDLYTKAGESGTASSYLVLIPDYGVGFTILSAASISTRNAVVGAIGDLISNALLPALEAQAAAETEHAFAGQYNSTIEGVDSSLVLSVNKTAGAPPGLLIESFISNGTDFAAGNPFYFAPGARLVPSISDTSSKRQAFRIATAADAPNVDKSATLFSGAGTADFLVGDAIAYGSISLSLFEFQLGDDGVALAASPSALRIELQKAD